MSDGYGWAGLRKERAFCQIQKNAHERVACTLKKHENLRNPFFVLWMVKTDRFLDPPNAICYEKDWH